MHDTIYILPNHILATMDTLRFVSTKVNDISDRFYQYLGIIIPAVVSILSVLFVARSAKRGIEESSLNTAKQLDNAFSIAQLNVNNSIKLVERQTYVDLILRDKNIWRGELMEISAQIEKETISFLTSEQSIDKQQHKAHISYLIKKMQTRLSTKDKYPTHKELLLTLKQLDNFVKGINDHDFQNDEEVYKHLESIHTATYVVCKEVWDEIQQKCNWKDI